MTRQVYCDCACAKVDADRCDRCTPDWVYDDGPIEDPPLYPAGKLAAMSLEELERELDRQSDRQGRLGDAERIDDRAVEETEMRCRMVETEITRRKSCADHTRVDEIK